MMKIIPILMYHSISSDAGRKFKQFTLSPVLFDAHLKYLQKNKYTPMSVAQLAEFIQKDTFELPEKPVVITFDDGFMDFYEFALPSLQKYSFTATLYIVTGFLNESSRWLKSEGETKRKMLNWPQVLEIDRAGVECAPHSHTHADLDIVSQEIALTEIATSKNMLEQKLGHSVTTFAYPYGHYSVGVREMVQNAGFQAACGVRNALSHVNDHPFSLARITINDRTDVPQLAALLRGDGLSIAVDRETILTKTWRGFRRLRKAFGSLTVSSSAQNIL